MLNSNNLKKRKTPIMTSSTLTSIDIFNKCNNKKHKKTRNTSIENKKNLNYNMFKKLDYKNLLPLISKYILYSKLNHIQNDFNSCIINSLIQNKKGKANLYLTESKIEYDGKEYIEKIYKLKDSYHNIPLYYDYYKNYLKFFCKPYILEKFSHKILIHNMEKAAEIFYYEKFRENEKVNNYNLNNFPIHRIFSTNIIKEIENEKLETNQSNEKKHYVKRLINDNEDISSFYGISKINNISFDDSNTIKKKFIDLLDKKKSEIIIKKSKKQKLKNDLSNLNLKYFSNNIKRTKKKVKNHKYVLSKIKESILISPNKFVINSYNDLSTTPFNLYKFKENKNFKLKHNNSKSMNLHKGGKLTISTNLYLNINKIFKKKSVLFKKNNHYSSISSSLIKSPLNLYSNQSRKRLNSSNKKSNSFVNIKNGSYVLSPKKFLYKKLDDRKKYSEDSTRTCNSRNSNHSHQKIPMINISKNQISIDFIKAYRTKNKNQNIQSKKIIKSAINEFIKNNKSKL